MGVIIIADGKVVVQAEFDGKKAQKQAEQTANNISDKFQGIGEGLSAAGGAITAGVTLPILAVGGAALAVANDVKKSQALIKNSLGVTTEEAKILTQTAKDIYNKGFGESLEDVSRALIQTKQNIKGLNDEDLEKVTKSALNLAKVTESDVNEVTRAGSQLIKQFGIDSNQAFDLLAFGAQNGLNFSDELFDNLAEYTPLFKQMGFSAEETFQVLIQGSQAGVYNLDYVNDAVKEFGIRIKDGSKLTNESFAELSKSTQNTWQEFLKGKATGKDVFNSVIAELKGMDDQVKASEIGVGLFGTKFEDLEADAVYALGGIDGNIGDVKGSIDELNATAEESQSLTAVWRETKDALEPLGVVLLQMANEALPPLVEGFKRLSEWFQNLSPTGQKLVIVIGLLAAAIGPLLALIGFLIPTLFALATAEWAALAPLLPIIGIIALVIAAIIALGVVVYLVIKYWDDIKAFTLNAWQAILDFLSNAWDWIKVTAGNVWNWIKTTIGNAWNWVKTTTSNVWNWIKTTTSNVWNGIKDTISNVWNGIKSFVSSSVNNIKNTVSNIWNSIKSTTSNVWNSIKTTISNAITNALQSILNFKSKFLNAGKALLQSLADGIKAGVSKVTGAISDVLSKARDFLPFSPAKVGPLSDLDKSGEAFFPTFAQGIEKGLNVAVKDVEMGLSRLNQGLMATTNNNNQRTYQYNVTPAQHTIDERGLMRIIRQEEFLHG